MALDENMEKVIGELRRKRGVVKASLTRARKFVENFDSDVQAISLLEFRQEELPQINKKFDEVQCEIELISAGDADDADGERDKFEQEYFAIRSQMQELINSKKSSSTQGLNASFGQSNASQRVRLAPIALPCFNGKIEEWRPFYDSFRAMVHGDESLTTIQKFYYLRSSLNETALDVIKAIPLTDVNYEVALDKLRKRYDNRSLTIQSHIRALLECPRVNTASAKELQGLSSHVSTHVAALKAIGQPVQHWDAWLVTIVLSKLDQTTSHEWQLRQSDTEMPKFDELERFLASRCIAFETSEAWSNQVDEIKYTASTSKKVSHNASAKKVTLAAIDVSKDKCICCDESHKLYACDKFKQLSVNDRLQLARESRLCFNCLSPFHMAINCRSKWTCPRCKKKHNSLLHFEVQKEEDNKKNEQVGEISAERSSHAEVSLPVSLTINKPSDYVFLATAVVLITGSQGVQFKCRAVLDSGSQVNFIRRSLLNSLQIKPRKTSLPVRGVGASSVQAAAVADIHIKSRVKQYDINLSCYVLPTIVSELPPCAVPKGGWKIPSEYVDDLADPTFDKTGSIDLLIGGGLFYELLESERIRLDVGSLSLQGTKFGWVVTGEVGVTCLLSTSSIGKGIEEDWVAVQSNKEEMYGRQSKGNQKSLDAKAALEHFVATFKRDVEGRFVLRLPVKSEIIDLGDTLSMARSRFINVERKLQRDEELRTEYVNFMDDYLKMGHMEEVDESEIPSRVCYLPHHAVVKKSSLTTKVRVVFDASAKGSKGQSLNDILLCGPTIQEDVFTILCRFRKHLYVMVADVEKMYRQVAIAPEDRDLQRIVWRTSPSAAIQTYRLTTVTYGTASASFMATQCLAILADQFEEKYPKAAKAVKFDFYMDDLMTGSDKEEDCLSLQQEITVMMDSVKFPLRKWCSNSALLRERLGKCHKDPMYALEIGDEDSIKSLGLGWKPVLDEFQFNVAPSPVRNKLTKRVILAELNRIFDPLGFLSPVLVCGKIFLQQLWQIKADWDSVLPEDIQGKWIRFHDELAELQLLSISRGTRASVDDDVEIHGFCDASREAYGACIYVRSRNSEKMWKVQLLCARSRVAPMKGSTIPRLELNGAVVLAQLIHKVAESWEIDCRKCFLWTDSMVVLNWLNAQSNRLKVYVSNRVNQILELTNAPQWNYVQTDKNPADLISRGTSVKEMCASKLWWEGPNWLSISDELWERVPRKILDEDEIPEQRPIRLVLAGIQAPQRLLQYYSTWQRLQRATAWLQQFVKYLKTSQVLSRGYLSVNELKLAEICILKQTQYDVFFEELQSLESGKELKSRSKLRCLRPFINNGLILVGGRLENSNLLLSQIHPIVLPAQHKVTRLIFEQKHKEQLHCGPQALLAEVRRKYWPLRGRVMARSVVSRCVQCTRAKPKFNAPLMAPLPIQRVQPVRPFSVSGVDFAGPLIIRSGIRRVVGIKAWIAVFVCFTTRAIHLEAVEDLSSKAFIAALRRFISRRGHCSTIFSDNGTNFVGAQRELKSYVLNAQPFAAQEGIEWRFNPPSAPHFGGLWESAVKSAKYHLTRVMGDARLSFCELNTLLCQIEACLNSRPLTPLSTDPSELEALTPAHFLIGGPMTLPPEPDLQQESLSGVRRWKYVQALMQIFWRRWKCEYLPQYQVRGKWTTSKAPLQIGNIVIIKDECTPPTKWKLGRVVETHPGKDGIIRVVTVRTGSGAEMKRPTVKLCLLPNEEEPESVETFGSQRGENVYANQ